MFARGLEGREQEFLDSLHVMEVGMRHFFAKAMQAKANKGKPETIDANMLQAVSIAEKIAPYRHARLSAVKEDKLISLLTEIQSDIRQIKSDPQSLLRFVKQSP